MTKSKEYVPPLSVKPPDKLKRKRNETNETEDTDVTNVMNTWGANVFKKQKKDQKIPCPHAKEFNCKAKFTEGYLRA